MLTKNTKSNQANNGNTIEDSMSRLISDINCGMSLAINGKKYNFTGFYTTKSPQHAKEFHKTLRTLLKNNEDALSTFNQSSKTISKYIDTLLNLYDISLEAQKNKKELIQRMQTGKFKLDDLKSLTTSDEIKQFIPKNTESPLLTPDKIRSFVPEDIILRAQKNAGLLEKKEIKPLEKNEIERLTQNTRQLVDLFLEAQKIDIEKEIKEVKKIIKTNFKNKLTKEQTNKNQDNDQPYKYVVFLANITGNTINSYLNSIKTYAPKCKNEQFTLKTADIKKDLIRCENITALKKELEKSLDEYEQHWDRKSKFTQNWHKFFNFLTKKTTTRKNNIKIINDTINIIMQNISEKHSTNNKPTKEIRSQLSKLRGRFKNRTYEKIESLLNKIKPQKNNESSSATINHKLNKISKVKKPNLCSQTNKNDWSLTTYNNKVKPLYTLFKQIEKSAATIVTKIRSCFSRPSQ
ncbi:MAG: hypothetical protein PVG30_02530 [Gammaproteobacteria bacterium]|jgi:hypothetical protein